MSDILETPVLVLNRNYQPVRLTSVRYALTLMYGGRASAMDDTYTCFDFERWQALEGVGQDESIRTVRGAIRVPRIVVLHHYHSTRTPKLRLSRRHVFVRDNYTCQYCALSLPARELNLDHVVPKSRGGPTSWDNLVTSCRKCNLKKGRMLPQECGMVPRRRPVCPPWTLALHATRVLSRHHYYASWQPFLPEIPRYFLEENQNAA